jgi:hypothetical protein
LWTDHKPLDALSCISAPISQRQQRHLAFISEFNAQMLYLPNLKNGIADFLSRLPPPPRSHLELSLPRRWQIHLTSKPWLLSKITAQKTQPLLSGSSLKIALQQTGAQLLVGDVSTGVFLPIVPEKFRKGILLHLHNISHPGRLTSRHLVSSRFVWCGLSNDITIWTRSCLHCQQSKIHHHTRLLPQPIPIPQRKFAHLHINLVGS